MKKITVLLCMFMCSCRSLTYQDVNPTIQPNDNLLPALESVVDINNLETTYSSGSMSGVANNFGNTWAGNNWGGWAQTTAMNASFKKDMRVGDVVAIFNKEIKENISTPYGEKKGYISLKLGYRGNDRSMLYLIPSALTVFTINLFGFPYDKNSQSLEVEIEIWNNKKEVVKRYVENVYDSEYMALYWGYPAPTLYRKVAADNIKQALQNIRLKINQDASEIKRKLEN